jgi:bifunctional UDP-N-acetylglucosamine pyrophosphorylase/glucosamine-1-phosphate N-acetyltransferase
MASALPKALHPLAGRPLIGWVLETVQKLSPEKIVVVAAPGMDDLAAAVAPHKVAIQQVARGTGDAVRAALPELKGFSGDVLVLLADMPLLSLASLRGLIAARHAEARTGLAVLGAEFENPPAFGRLVVGADGALEKIVEDKDCTPEEKKITLCNTGAFCLDGARLAGWAGRIGNDNAQGEFYFTDIVAIAAADGASAQVSRAADAWEIMGVNSRADLAALEKTVQKRLRAAAMDGGATLLDPDTVYLSWDTQLGRDVLVEPNVFFAPGVRIGSDVHIRSGCYLEGAHVAEGCVIGPYARLRPGSEIGATSKIGNFVEIKNARLGEGVKASHLAYIGDADVGANANFSCGAITANYDGYVKNRTVIGADAMIGSNATLIAPVTVGAGAYVAAATTVTKDVPEDALSVGREKPVTVEGWAARKRAKHKK